MDAETKAKKMTLDLTWSMKLDEKRLRIDYKVTNNTKASVQVVDGLIWQNAVNVDVIIVRNDTQSKTLAFTRALVRTNEKMMHTPMPTARELAAGASMEGHAFVAWPPFAWHNFSKVDALVPGATHAVLEIGYVDHPASKLEPMKVGRQTPTHMGSQKLLRGDAQPLPK